MASTPTLNLRWNNPVLYPSPQKHNLSQAYIPFHPFEILPFKIRTSNIRRSDASVAHLASISKAPMNLKIEQNPVEFVVQTIIKALKAIKKPAAAAVLLALLLMYNPSSAMPASGGRMGGSLFSSGSSTSYNRGSATATSGGSMDGSFSSSGSSTSYDPGSEMATSGGSMGGSSCSSWPSMSSRSYSTPRIKVESDFSYSVPYYAPSQPSATYIGPAVGSGADFSFVMLAVVAFVLLSRFENWCTQSRVPTDTNKTTVLNLQIGLLGLGRSLQKDLNRIAEIADTSTSKGLRYVLAETILSILRHPDYCISAYSSVDVKKSIDEGERRFNQLSIEERGKFDEETFVNVNNIKKQGSTILSSSGFSNEYIVITIVLAAVGVHKMSSISSSKDLKEALQKLASIPSSRILAVEVLWTPQKEEDALSEQELLEDYPLLRPLQEVESFQHLPFFITKRVISTNQFTNPPLPDNDS